MIQINVDMPTNCTQCPFSDDESRYCRVANECIPMFSNPDFCPLIEVKDGCEQKMTHQELMIECDMLQGNVNRMMVTKDIRELVRMHEFAEMRLQKIYKWRVKELVAKMERGE